MTATPIETAETVEVRAPDGHTLFADVHPPRGRRPRGIALLAHAMFARRTSFARPRGRSVADVFREAGYVTLTLDFRGHGDSGPGAESGASWSFDDLVRHDLPVVAECARAQLGDLPLVVVGHSLGGNVALAAQGLGLLGADALVLVATNMWTRRDEPSLRMWAMKRAVVEALYGLARRKGYVPARALRIGSDDEPLRYFETLVRCVRRGRWTSEDGRHDYAELAANVRVPVATVSSDGDRLFCTPGCAERMAKNVRGERLSIRLTEADGGGRPPGHMGIVTSGAALSAYRSVVGWLDGALPRG